MEKGKGEEKGEEEQGRCPGEEGKEQIPSRIGKREKYRPYRLVVSYTYNGHVLLFATLGTYRAR